MTVIVSSDGSENPVDRPRFSIGDRVLFASMSGTLRFKGTGQHWVFQSDEPVQQFLDEEEIPEGCSRWQDMFDVLERDLRSVPESVQDAPQEPSKGNCRRP